MIWIRHWDVQIFIISSYRSLDPLTGNFSHLGYTYCHVKRLSHRLLYAKHILHTNLPVLGPPERFITIRDPFAIYYLIYWQFLHRLYCNYCRTVSRTVEDCASNHIVYVLHKTSVVIHIYNIRYTRHLSIIFETFNRISALSKTVYWICLFYLISIRRSIVGDYRPIDRHYSINSNIHFSNRVPIQKYCFSQY